MTRLKLLGLGTTIMSSSLLIPLLCLFPSVSIAGETTIYSYDELGRLISSSSSGTVNDGQNVSITLDPAGNRTNYVASGVGAGSQATISVASASAVEGASLTFVVTRTGNTSTAVSASYAAASGTAIAPGDFGAISGTVSFLAGETSKTITVATVDDAIVEGTETMTVTLSAPVGGAVLGTYSAVGTITDNDTAPVTLSISDAAALEGYVLNFTVTRSGSTAGSNSVSYATAIGTAGNLDFVSLSGTLNFAPGEATKAIGVSAKTDAKAELDEVFYLNLSGATGGATIIRSQGVGTIYDDGNGGTGGCTTC